MPPVQSPWTKPTKLNPGGTADQIGDGGGGVASSSLRRPLLPEVEQGGQGAGAGENGEGGGDGDGGGRGGGNATNDPSQTLKFDEAPSRRQYWSAYAQAPPTHSTRPRL